MVTSQSCLWAAAEPWGGCAGSAGAPESQQTLLESSWGVGLCGELQTTSCGVKRGLGNSSGKCLLLLLTWLTQSCAFLRDGDHYDALRDCLKAISLNPCHLKAHFRLARCLFELKYVAEALECLDDFKGKFPEQAHSSACDALDRDINAALFSKSDNGECCCWAPPRLC